MSRNVETSKGDRGGGGIPCMAGLVVVSDELQMRSWIEGIRAHASWSRVYRQSTGGQATSGTR